MVWKKIGYFIPAVAMFAIAQLFYAKAFGFKDLKIKHGICCGILCFAMFFTLLPSLEVLYIERVKKQKKNNSRIL